MNEVNNGFGAIPEGFSAASMDELKQVVANRQAIH